MAVLAVLAVGIPAATAPADEPARSGEQLFALCTQCHGTAGEGKQLFLAPTIAGLDQWYLEEQLSKFKSGIRGTHPDDLGGLRMYPMSLWLQNDAEIQAVAAHVAALPPKKPEPTLEGGDAAKGQVPYSTICATCHGADGGGNEAMKAPALAGMSDWYLLESLKKYKAGVRGSNPKDINGSAMRGMAATLADEQAMKDVVAHILTLSE